MSRKAIGVSNRYFYSNEMMVDIRLVLVLCPRDIFLDEKTINANTKNPTEMLLISRRALERWTRSSSRWRIVESKRKRFEWEVAELLPGACCWNWNRCPTCSERISDVLAMIPLSPMMSRCENESNSWARCRLQIFLRSPMNLNCSGYPF